MSPTMKRVSRKIFKVIFLTQANASSRGKSRYDWLFALFAWTVHDVWRGYVDARDREREMEEYAVWKVLE